MALVAIAGLAIVVVIRWWSDHEHRTFVAEQRSEAAAFRVEYVERDGLLFVHRPDGETDGVDLATLQRVLLYRIRAQDSSDGKARYWWAFEGPGRVVSFPFFLGEPAAMTAVLRTRLAGFNEAAALEMARTFEHDRSSFCQVWASAGYLDSLKETHTRFEPGCQP